MKKILLISLSIVLIVIALLFTFPYFFKDKIKAKVDSEIAKKVDAKVFYGDLDLSIFKNFPQITVPLSNFGVVGNAPFLGDTLVAATEFNTSFNVMSIFKEDHIKVNSIALNQPKILIKTLKDGSNNYDIINQSCIHRISMRLSFMRKKTDFTHVASCQSVLKVLVYPQDCYSTIRKYVMQ